MSCRAHICMHGRTKMTVSMRAVESVCVSILSQHRFSDSVRLRLAAPREAHALRRARLCNIVIIVLHHKRFRHCIQIIKAPFANRLTNLADLSTLPARFHPREGGHKIIIII